MIDIIAAIGLAQLKNIKKIINLKNIIHNSYKKEFLKIKFISNNDLDAIQSLEPRGFDISINIDSFQEIEESSFDVWWEDQEMYL